MIESALSMFGGPLAGATVNTGMSKGQLMETLDDYTNRQARRATPRRTRG